MRIQSTIALAWFMLGGTASLNRRINQLAPLGDEDGYPEVLLRKRREMDGHYGLYIPTRKRVLLAIDGPWPRLTYVHEMAHHIWTISIVPRVLAGDSVVRGALERLSVAHRNTTRHELHALALEQIGRQVDLLVKIGDDFIGTTHLSPGEAIYAKDQITEIESLAEIWATGFTGLFAETHINVPGIRRETTRMRGFVRRNHEYAWIKPTYDTEDLRSHILPEVRSLLSHIQK